MEESEKNQPNSRKFSSILQTDVPKGRDGKHKKIVQRLLDNIDHLQDGLALKIPLADLPDSKENIRSALSRATKQLGIEISTSSDDDNLYVWRTDH